MAAKLSLLEDEWTRQPPPGTGINWKNPITRGLLLAMSGKENNLNKTIGGNDLVVTAVGKKGIALVTPTWEFYNSVGGNYITPQSSIFILAKARNEVTANQGVVGYDVSSKGSYLKINSANRWRFSVYDTAQRDAADTTAPSITEFEPICGTHDGVTARIYRNGNQTASVSAGNATGSATDIRFGACSGSYGSGSSIACTFVWNRALTKGEVKALSDNPWQIFEPEEIPLFKPVTSGATNLFIFDSSHAHAGDTLTFSLDTYLAAQDSTHAHSADNLTLDATTSISLVLSESLHGLSSDVIAFITGSYLQVADALHGHSADALTLATASFLAVADALHSHAADNLTLDTSNATPLTTQDSAHAHSADNTALTLDTWLAIVEAIHAQSADNVSISSEELLAIADALHSHASDALLLSIPSAPGTCPSVAEIVAAIWADPRALTVAKFLGLK